MRLRRTLATLTLALLLSGAAAAVSRTPGLKIRSDRSVPESLGVVSDIRWAGADSLYLTAGPVGVLRVKSEPAWGEPEIVLPATGDLWAAARLGVAPGWIAAGAPGMVIAWRRLPAGAVRSLPVDTVMDLDVTAGRLVLLGARKDAKGRYAPDGAIAWLGSLDHDLSDLRPILFSVSGPGARDVDACGAFETGAVRFLTDGSALVVPGVEPNILLVDPAGKLKRTWEAKDAGLDAGCGLSEDQMLRLSQDLRARSAWINQRRVLDEIVPLADGAGLFVRSVAGEKTLWALTLLRPDGRISSQPLPFTAPSPDWHLRADIRGDRLAVLLNEYAVGHPPAPSRLIFLDVNR